MPGPSILPGSVPTGDEGSLSPVISQPEELAITVASSSSLGRDFLPRSSTATPTRMATPKYDVEKASPGSIAFMILHNIKSPTRKVSGIGIMPDRLFREAEYSVKYCEVSAIDPIIKETLGLPLASEGSVISANPSYLNTPGYYPTVFQSTINQVCKGHEIDDDGRLKVKAIFMDGNLQLPGDCPMPEDLKANLDFLLTQFPNAKIFLFSANASTAVKNKGGTTTHRYLSVVYEDLFKALPSQQKDRVRYVDKAQIIMEMMPFFRLPPLPKLSSRASAMHSTATNEMADEGAIPKGAIPKGATKRLAWAETCAGSGARASSTLELGSQLGASTGAGATMSSDNAMAGAGARVVRGRIVDDADRSTLDSSSAVLSKLEEKPKVVATVPQSNGFCGCFFNRRSNRVANNERESTYSPSDS
ncbi:MAG: hypothetical protein Q7V63_06010 [Gammaproteobacteria bacterium]|nr:hypothetical protein [Gammaproteobacteria bacterium]